MEMSKDKFDGVLLSESQASPEFRLKFSEIIGNDSLKELLLDYEYILPKFQFP